MCDTRHDSPSPISLEPTAKPTPVTLEDTDNYNPPTNNGNIKVHKENPANRVENKTVLRQGQKVEVNSKTESTPNGNPVNHAVNHVSTTTPLGDTSSAKFSPHHQSCDIRRLRTPTNTSKDSGLSLGSTGDSRQCIHGIHGGNSFNNNSLLHHGKPTRDMHRDGGGSRDNNNRHSSSSSGSSSGGSNGSSSGDGERTHASSNTDEREHCDNSDEHGSERMPTHNGYTTHNGISNNIGNDASGISNGKRCNNVRHSSGDLPRSGVTIRVWSDEDNHCQSNNSLSQEFTDIPGGTGTTSGGDFLAIPTTKNNNHKEPPASPPSPTPSTSTSTTSFSPPDGGYGWVVVFASFSISMLVDGVCFSFGMFVEDFKREFNTDNSTVSWIGSVLNGTYMVVGPLVGALCNIYGCRRVAGCGAVLASAAIFVSTFSDSIVVLILTFGFVGGVGFGLMYLPAIVMVGYYFQARRALATGIACCGSGMGAFLFAPLCQLLLDEFGWRGALLILSGLVLNGLVFAFFYRPLPVGEPIRDEEEAVTMAANGGGEEGRPLIGQDDKYELTERPVPMSDTVDGPGSQKKAKSSTELLSVYGRTITPRIWPEYHGSESSPCTGAARLAHSAELTGKVGHGGLSCGDRRSWQRQQRSDTAVMQPLRRKDIFYSGSLARLPVQIKRECSTSHSVSCPKDSSSVTDRENQCMEALASLFDVKLLKSPTFIIYGLSCFFCMAGFFVPFTYMPTHAMAMDLDKKSAAFLISIIGITNIIGRVAVGFISDMAWADCLLINNLALIMGGLATALVPHFYSYWTFALYSAVFGTSIAVFVSLRSIIMVELMGLEKLTTAFGFVVMCQGASSFIGAPIAGAVSDMTGSYDYAFYMAGAIFTLSGVICLPLRRVARWEGLLQGTETEVK